MSPAPLAALGAGRRRHALLQLFHHAAGRLRLSGRMPQVPRALHCCKQCAYFEPSTRFQCVKPIPVRIVVKDQANDCALFKPRVTVARDSAAPPPASSTQANNGSPRRAMPMTPAPPSTAYLRIIASKKRLRHPQLKANIPISPPRSRKRSDKRSPPHAPKSNLPGSWCESSTS